MNETQKSVQEALQTEAEVILNNLLRCNELTIAAVIGERAALTRIAMRHGLRVEWAVKVSEDPRGGKQDE